jgi:hypothetical protein
MIAKLSPPPRIVTICDGYICISCPDPAPHGTGGTVTWGIPSDAQGCAVGSPTNPSTPVSTSRSAPTGPLYEESTFALSCLDPQGDFHHVQLNIVVTGPQRLACARAKTPKLPENLFMIVLLALASSNETKR